MMCAALTLIIWPLLIVSFYIAPHAFVRFQILLILFHKCWITNIVEFQEQLHFGSTVLFYPLYSMSRCDFIGYCNIQLRDKTVLRHIILLRMLYTCEDTE